jgi:hypothetical protein
MEIEFQGVRITQEQVDKWFATLSVEEREKIIGNTSKNKIDLKKMKIKKIDTQTIIQANQDVRYDFRCS